MSIIFCQKEQTGAGRQTGAWKQSGSDHKYKVSVQYHLLVYHYRTLRTHYRYSMGDDVVLTHSSVTHTIPRCSVL